MFIWLDFAWFSKKFIKKTLSQMKKNERKHSNPFITFPIQIFIDECLRSNCEAAVSNCSQSRTKDFVKECDLPFDVEIKWDNWYKSEKCEEE